MKMKYLSTILIFLIMFHFTILPSSAQQTPASGRQIPEFMIMTEPWIPYQFEKDGKIQGIAVDLLVLMLEKIGSKQGRKDIRMYPWARGYNNLSHLENTILFLTARTKEREHLFKWVGPICMNSLCLIAKKNKHIKIDTIADIKRYQVGTVKGDVSEQYLVQAGIPLSTVQRNNMGVYNISKLQFDKIDIVIQSFPGFVEGVRTLGFNSDDFECVFKLSSTEMCYAFHKNTEDWIIEKFQSALEQLIAEGKLDAINQRYSKPIAN